MRDVLQSQQLQGWGTSFIRAARCGQNVKEYVMRVKSKANKALLLATGTMLATGLLSLPDHFGLSHAYAQEVVASPQSSASLAAEKAVRKEPLSMAKRAALATSYMRDGRFQSAVTSFEDAITLGDESTKTVLSLALAQIASGDAPTALRTLDRYRNTINPSDLGLAFALAGDPDSGVRILSAAIRSGDNNVKSRQNLAYAYAMQGNWRAARLMAAHDLPESRLGERLSEWASLAQDDMGHARIAGLLNVPMVADRGRPVDLALVMPAVNAVPSVQAAKPVQLAQSKVSSKPAPAVTAHASVNTAPKAVPAASSDRHAMPISAAASVAKSGDEGELPALARTAEPVFAAKEDTKSAEPATFAEAFRQPVPTAPNGEFAGQKAAPVKIGSHALSPKTARAPSSRPEARHLVQLGSFSSAANAERAWEIYSKRDPSLRKFERVITKAKVGGKTYYRVSAGVMARADANAMCSLRKSQGQGCFVWAKNTPLPGALVRELRSARL